MKNSEIDRLPVFGYPGSKCRLRQWLMQFLPKAGSRYVEPFAGLGNVFYLARRDLRFQSWWINDGHPRDFLNALAVVDPNELPPTVDREVFARLTANRETDVAKVVEYRVTVLGKGYDAGFSGETRISTGQPKVGYTGQAFAKQVRAAQALLKDVRITNWPWERVLAECVAGDFVYLDPPYFGTYVSTYKNIDHAALLRTLAAAPYAWALSGYPSDLYRQQLGEPVATFDRRAEMAAASSKRETRRECVWLSPKVGAEAFPPVGWFPHPDAPGWFHNYKECLTEVQLRARTAA